MLHSRLGPIGCGGRVGLADDRVDDAVVSGFVRAHPVVAIDVVRDPLDGLAGVGGHHLLKPAFMRMISRAWTSMSAAVP